MRLEFPLEEVQISPGIDTKENSSLNSTRSVRGAIQIKIAFKGFCFYDDFVGGEVMAN